jgi:hypothetical protein
MIYAGYLGSTSSIDSIATPRQWQIHPLTNRSEKPQGAIEILKSIYKKFKQHPPDRERYDL